MLDGRTSDGKVAFDFTEWGDIADDPTAVESKLAESMDSDEASVLAIWRERSDAPGAYRLAGVIHPDALRDWLIQTGVLSHEVA